MTEKNLLIVSTDEDFYGSIKGASSVVHKHVAEIILSKFPNEETMALVLEAVERHRIQGIIARGYWALYLEKHLDIPVFPFKLDAYDLLLNLDKLVHKGFSRIGLMSFVPTQKNTYTFGKINIINFHNTHCYLSHIRNDEELKYVLDKMTSIYNIDAIFGDKEGMIVAQNYGISCFPLQLSGSFLINTIEEAENMLSRIEREKKHTEYIETLTNIISECSVFTNELGKILFYNLKADTTFSLKEGGHSRIQELIGLPDDELLKEQVNRMVEINEKFYIMNVIPVALNGQQTYSFLFSNTQSIEHKEMAIRRQSHENGLLAKHHFSDIIYSDEGTKQTINMAKRYASSNGTVLITGESGTGKEVYANAIHNESARKNGPFVAINCATFNENLIESELFGYEKGSFTGALSSGKRGLFELAHKGTLFLDEIGELSVSMQAKLLRVLQEHEVRHLGGSKNIPVDVRIIAATNKDLRQMVLDGSFREDLFFRLSLLELSLLPLRRRQKDIIPIFEFFLARLIDKSGKKLYWTNDSIFAPLLDYEWPGNIRELENIAERAVLLTDSMQLTKDFIQSLIGMNSKNRFAPAKAAEFTLQVQPDLNMLEARYIEFLLTRAGGDKDAVCRYLNISKPTLWRKLAYIKNSDASPKFH